MKLNEPIPQFKPLAYPIGDVIQFFGENITLYKNCCNMQGHNGWDIVRAHGTPIYCVAGGKVVERVDGTTGYGKQVRVLTETDEWVYGHLSRIDVALGQNIASGGQIGLMGNTGFVVSGSTPYWKHNPYAGTHLHLGRRPVKPWDGAGDYIRYSTGEEREMRYYQNGFLGSISPSPDEFGTSPPQELKPSDRIAVLAAQYQAEGRKDAAILFAIAAMLKAFGQ